MLIAENFGIFYHIFRHKLRTSISGKNYFACPGLEQVTFHYSTNCATNSLRNWCTYKRRQDTWDRRQETYDRRRESVDLRQEQETGDRRQETWDMRQETWDRRCETGDVRQEPWDRRYETWDRRRETEDGIQETRPETGDTASQEKWFFKQCRAHAEIWRRL